MPIIFSYDGKTMDVDDVPLEVYDEIQRKTGQAWYQVADAPAAHAGAAIILATKCAEMLDVKLPELTPRTIIGMFQVAEGENRPTEYTDGSPDPKAGDTEPETT